MTLVVFGSLVMATRKSRKLQRRARQIEAQSEALRESEATYRALFEASIDSLSILDPETGCFVDCNEGALRLFGFASRERFIGSSPQGLSPEFQPACARLTASPVWGATSSW